MVLLQDHMICITKSLNIYQSHPMKYASHSQYDLGHRYVSWFVERSNCSSRAKLEIDYTTHHRPLGLTSCMFAKQWKGWFTKACVVYVSHQLQLSAWVQEKRNIFDQLVRLERFIRDGLLNQSNTWCKCFLPWQGAWHKYRIMLAGLPKIGPLMDTSIF